MSTVEQNSCKDGLLGEKYYEEDITRRNSQSSEEPIETLVISQRSRKSSLRIITFFTFLNISALIVIYFSLALSTDHGLYLGLFPQPEYEIRMFYEDNMRPGPEADTEWKAALPHAHGFTIVDDPDSLGLPVGQPSKDGLNKYGVTWAHQYHCLWMLREEFWKLVQRNSSLVGVDMDGPKNDDRDYLWHLAHCFGYLKETVICAMDMTLEYPTLGGENAGTINGYEIPHKCIKREPWDDFMDDHAPDEAHAHFHKHGSS